MSEFERIVWAAVYAKYWTGTHNDTLTAIENAWAAVINMREAANDVEEGWGKDHGIYLFLDEML